MAHNAVRSHLQSKLNLSQCFGQPAIHAKDTSASPQFNREAA